MLPVPPIELASYRFRWAAHSIGLQHRYSRAKTVPVSRSKHANAAMAAGAGHAELKIASSRNSRNSESESMAGESQWQMVGPTPQVQPKPVQPSQAMQPMPMQATPTMQAIPGMPPGPFAFGGYGGYGGYGPPCGGPCLSINFYSEQKKSKKGSFAFRTPFCESSSIGVRRIGKNEKEHARNQLTDWTRFPKNRPSIPTDWPSRTVSVASLISSRR